MIDTADTQTVDLFPQTPKKTRGRPATGQAKSNAQRQADYRRKKRHEGGAFGKSNLNLWISSDAKAMLDRIARHKNRTPDQVLAMLLKAEEQHIIKDMPYISDEYNHYFRDFDNS